jgi:hypothetical protein
MGIAAALSAMGGASLHLPQRSAANALVDRASSNSHCSRQCMTKIVNNILDSMVAHNPYTLPLATVYKATENSHPAALAMMTSWRTITEASAPSLLAIDTKNGTAYFALDFSEGNRAKETILRGRVKVVDRLITELELFINRNRGNHGFSFSATELAANYADLMSPPANRTKASREALYNLSEALFSSTSDLSITIGDDCQFTELGWKVIDAGTNGNGSTTPLVVAGPPITPQTRTHEWPWSSTKSWASW